ncbi:NAD(P)H-dependent flavin oxidoreductase [Blautia faecicola]|uniref:Probable nitronate monooxygenase n=1 Tax=Blautia faecicola TaxID=2509240 RepID=A0A4Q1REA4_9FIRM|nr:nitronate monooxygenase [Blautia faecicola]RXS73818.1 nitronate monooxygenase [Blautia faecicola]
MKALKIGELTARIPVIQGGMGVGISLSGLAGSVAACGGVGVISTAQIGYRDPEFEKDPIGTNLRVIGEEIRKARAIAKGGILGVNIMVATRQYAEYVKAAVKSGIDLIISGAGLPMDLPKLVAGSKTKIAPIVSTVKAARVICRFWDHHYQRMPDLVVIEGPKAGGHLGFSRKQLEEFTPVTYDQEIRGILAEVKKYADKYGKEIPVVVAGGIFTREDMLHAMELGADGVQMGTRFVTTWECDASEAYKQTYLHAKKEDIVIVDSPVGMPGRAIRNRFLEEKESRRESIKKCYQCIATCNPANTPYCITRALVHAAKGETDDALLFCGENAWRCEKMENVADIMAEFA